MSAIRPILPQDPALESVALIEVRHPCQDVELFSFWLRRCPLADGSMSANACIPLTVILDACAILTGDYTYTAAICNDRDGEGPVLPGLVNAGTYYLIPDVANPRADYAVYKTFDHWIPPLRSQLPDRWFTAKCPKDTTLYIGDAELGSEYKVARSQISAAVKAVDKVCMMTLAAIPLASAHIVPVSCALWFQKRRIPRQLYIPHVLPHHLTPEFYVHDYRNHITLREDIRSLWDAYEWICVPVGDTFIAYVITDIRASLGFHCYSPRLPDRTDGYLLFLRFALAVFHQFAGSDDLATHKDHDPIAIKPSGANRRGRASGVSVKPTLPDTTEAQDDVNTAVDEDGGSGVSHSIGSSVDGLPECDIDDRGVARLIIEGFEKDGLELPEDMEAYYIDKFPDLFENRDEMKSRWFKEHPEIRMVSNPQEIATSPLPSSPIAPPPEDAMPLTPRNCGSVSSTPPDHFPFQGYTERHSDY